ncbi:MAG: S8 family serine peptidase [Ignavibacteriae bacterium]|nr:S8 family serine peptidase [Ignavibacteriota bacterium]MCB9215094.1 S8 family serine peptidase [Ignavibacteria bacterium]
MSTIDAIEIEGSIQSVAKGSNRKDKGGRSSSSKRGEECQRCSTSPKSSELISLQEYESSQVTLLYFYLLGQNPTLTPDALLCRSCLEEGERELQRMQIVKRRGEPHYVDPVLGFSPILSTPERVNASPHYTGAGVTIAFVDSGFAPHPDLILPVNRVLAVYDAVKGREVRDFERDFSEEPPISAWHGTMAATVAAGSGHLSDGYYRGIAPDARLVFVKAMTPEHHIRTPQVKRGLEWLLENHKKYNVRVINLSLGVDETTRSMRHPVIALVEELTRQGVVVVAASGNNPSRPLVPPGSAPSAITVGGYNDHNSGDWKSHEFWHSSYGKTPSGARKPELLGPAIWVAAPILLRTGVKGEAEALFYMAGAKDDALMRSIPVLARETGITKELLSAKTPLRARSLVLERIRVEKQINTNYKHVDGTSFAAPILSSVVAQMLEANPALTPAEVKNIMQRSAEPIKGVAPEMQGFGLLRADKSVEVVRSKLVKRKPRNPR